MTENRQTESCATLPDYYQTAAQDIMEHADRKDGIWMDVGSGSGGLGLAVASVFRGVMILLDPNEQALEKAVRTAAERGLRDRVVPVIGKAESIPLPAGAVDMVISRGSIFFWNDKASGLREIHRVLRPGGKAMIGGGLGSRYPEWARQEFIRRQRHSQRDMSEEEKEAFTFARHPETFRCLAGEAGLNNFEVNGEGGLGADDSNAGIGIWLRFEKGEMHDI
jgi:SAM-dependent methyltransferase